MGYALYETPRGDAGYAVEDICHQEGCTNEIDRGLSYLCGTIPGRDCEIGCGWWFCSSHLYMLYDAVSEEHPGSSWCAACKTAYDKENPDAEARDEEAFQQRMSDRYLDERHAAELEARDG